MLRLPAWEVKPQLSVERARGERDPKENREGRGRHPMDAGLSVSPIRLAPTFQRVLRSAQERLRLKLRQRVESELSVFCRFSLNLTFASTLTCFDLTMPNITLLVSPSCGACPSAKSLWKQLKVKYSFSYREVDITTKDGQELADRHSVRAVPATIIDGRLTFVGVPSRESAEKAILLKIKQREEG